MTIILSDNNKGASMKNHFIAEKITREQFTGLKMKNLIFQNCDFSGADLTDSEFIDCKFYDKDNQLGCKFDHAVLKNASFKNCDLSMASFRNILGLGIEIRSCLVQGADFRGANFRNIITARSWFCSAYITKSNLSYANLSGVVLEKCELWENRWNGTIISGSEFSGSDLSGGEFSSFDWTSANFTGCDLTNSQLGNIDIKRMNLQGIKLDDHQAMDIMESLGVTIIAQS